MGREPQFTAAQLLHAAPSPGWFLLGLIAVLLEPSALHAQPTCRTERQKPAGIDDRPRPSSLADAAGPRAPSPPPHLTRGGLAASLHNRLRSEIQPSRAGGFRAASVTQKRPLLNHAGRVNRRRIERDGGRIQAGRGI